MTIYRFDSFYCKASGVIIKFLPFFQQQLKGQDHARASFKEICARNRRQASEPKRDFQRCQHCRWGSCFSFVEENVLVELVFDHVTPKNYSPSIFLKFRWKLVMVIDSSACMDFGDYDVLTFSVSSLEKLSDRDYD